ncbi:hypothetical protein BOTBODRAFT_102054 [Botryobasidium botryosum FD-172 SS1]|uniref:Pali-domain-containing protein n=1 Tax=Botryobasidium botryosum (strain FD-172 SS1) TaxID=930990 RepID=A0A067MWD3_BOTB1|nr:hypothetical protein BOTBODRAFT_102054 [Botryobasidium botryosum FD-172 SS1]
MGAALLPRFIPPFFLFAAFLLSLLVSLSMPIIKAVYLFEITSQIDDAPITSVASSIRFGLWGWCAGAQEPQGPKYVHDAVCSETRLGYDVDPALLQLTGYPSLAQAVLKGLTVVLILHPVACGITFFSFLLSLLVACRPSTPHAIPIITLVLSIFPLFITTIAFGIDLGLVLICRSRVSSATGGSLTVRWGNGVWMTCAAWICLWISLFGLSAVACYCCGCGGPRSGKHFSLISHLHLTSALSDTNPLSCIRSFSHRPEDTQSESDDNIVGSPMELRPRGSQSPIGEDPEAPPPRKPRPETMDTARTGETSGSVRTTAGRFHEDLD